MNFKFKKKIFFFFFLCSKYCVSVYIPDNISSVELYVRLNRESIKKKTIKNVSLFKYFFHFAYEFKNLWYAHIQEKIIEPKTFSYPNIFYKINHSDDYHTIALPEGFTKCQIFKRFFHKNFVCGFIPAHIEEGYIYPNTLKFKGIKTFQELITPLEQKMKKVLNQYWEQIKDKDPVIKSQSDLLILASLIEKETQYTPEKPTISSVYKNRLRINMKLQCDPTVIYSLTKGCENLNRMLTHKDLKFSSPYNSYINRGLPPSPICNPGEDSIKSAAHHDSSDYLFFVASTKKKHRFSTNYEDHKMNVRLWKKELQKKQ